MKAIRTFYGMRERYHYDQTLEGYAQVDTGQDAPYFGLWANPVTLTFVCFCEGDETIQVCETAEEFTAEFARMKEYYGARFGIDPGWPKTPGCDALTAAFVSMELDYLLH